MSDYQTFRAPVSGGTLFGGIWAPDDREAPAVLAIHGVTASHLSWPFVAARLEAFRVIAPDLRGRARSRDLPGPYGIRQHADDMARLLDHFNVERAVVVGHSMGAFVAVRLAERHPDRVASLVLIDGGLPLPMPTDIDPSEFTAALLGPAASRLSMTFASREEYAKFWRAHPAFRDSWSQQVADYADYDLAGEEPNFYPSTRMEAVAEDSVQQGGGDGYTDALESLRVPVDFIRAPRGLLDEPTGLYGPDVVRASADRIDAMVVHETHDVNHYTVIMSEMGAAQVTPVIEHSATVSMVGKEAE
ncbi:MAG: alpha/beta fold hydrolase [Lacisediminihabitans sp.]